MSEWNRSYADGGVALTIIALVVSELAHWLYKLDHVLVGTIEVMALCVHYLALLLAGGMAHELCNRIRHLEWERDEEHRRKRAKIPL